MLHQPCTKLCPRIFIWPLLLQYSSNTNGEDFKKKGKTKLDISVHFVEKTKQKKKKKKRSKLLYQNLPMQPSCGIAYRCDNLAQIQGTS